MDEETVMWQTELEWKHIACSWMKSGRKGLPQNISFLYHPIFLSQVSHLIFSVFWFFFFSRILMVIFVSHSYIIFGCVWKETLLFRIWAQYSMSFHFNHSSLGFGLVLFIIYSLLTNNKHEEWYYKATHLACVCVCARVYMLVCF